MNKRLPSRGMVAISLSALFTAIALLVVWFTTSVLNIISDAVVISLLFVPVLVYVILSGRLTEIRAGGLEAKFTNEGLKSVEPVSETVEVSIQDMEVVAKGGLPELHSTLRQLDASKPVILTMTIGMAGYYDRDVLLEYIRNLLQYPTFRFVVFLSQEGKFVAYMPSWTIRRLLEAGQLGNDFTNAVNSGRAQDLVRYPGIITKAIPTKATNIEALQQMRFLNLEALVVVDEQRMPRGVVEREQILSQLMLAIANP